ncbi:DUF2188 domain-containing protein [Cupriavidus sp. CP313]
MEGQDFANQEDAIKAGTERAKRDKAELFIRGRDGKLRERNTPTATTPGTSRARAGTLETGT